MKIKLKCVYVVGRPGRDQKEHKPGTVLDLPKGDAEKLIAAQHAVPAGQPEQVASE